MYVRLGDHMFIT